MAHPELVPFERVRYLIEGAPVLLLPALPEVGSLPPLRLAEDGSVERCDGWRVAARLAMTIVDGPGDDGIAVQGSPGGDADDEHVMRWCEAVDAHEGAVVLAFDGWDAETEPSALLELALEHGARGGTMPDVPPG